MHIPLAEAIRALRRELTAAVREGGGEEVRFALGPVDLEFQVEVSKEAGGEAGIAFWLLTIGAKGTRTSGTAHTVRLSLTPVGPSGEERVIVHSEEVVRPD